jgi:hypothetical protein
MLTSVESKVGFHSSFSFEDSHKEMQVYLSFQGLLDFVTHPPQLWYLYIVSTWTILMMVIVGN